VLAPFETSFASSWPSVASEPIVSASFVSACLSTVPPLHPASATAARSDRSHGEGLGRMRTMFTAYVVFITSLIALYLVVGFGGH
jgi:hypothetical protein